MAVGLDRRMDRKLDSAAVLDRTGSTDDPKLLMSSTDDERQLLATELGLTEERQLAAELLSRKLLL